jgi:dihydroorotate dehydrogenase (fumarate)
MTDLRTRYLGLDLRSPLVASAGPLTGELETLIALEQAGAAAVVLPSLFEEEIEHHTNDIDRLAAGGPRGHLLSVDECLQLIEDAKRAIEIPVIASLNGMNIGGWLRHARLLESAGADAIEMNLYTVAADPVVSAAALESEQFGLVALLADELTVPLSVKISPYYTSLASFVLQLEEAGAAGVVMFNRFYQPDLDLETLDVTPRLPPSTPADVHLPLRWIGLLREHVLMSLAGSSGVHSGDDVAKLVLAGADAVMTTSALLRYGPLHLATIAAGLRDWMVDHDVASIDEMRGASRAAATDDPAAYERANYIWNLSTHPAWQ